MNKTSVTNFTSGAEQVLCSNSTDSGCWSKGMLTAEKDEPEDFLEQEISFGLVLWHIIFLASGAALSLVIFLCCCIKFRIPRTKQEIEADYIRKKITKKFQRRLKTIQNQDLDAMDLKRALDKIRAEFKSDTESLAHSEARFSVGSFSSAAVAGEKVHTSHTHRRASQIPMAMSTEDLRTQRTVAGRLSAAFSKYFGRSKVGQATSTSQGKAADASKPTPPPPPRKGSCSIKIKEEKI
ncbi:unnamed protein product [Allacma fusca]|uniref:Transmembrane inner ear expressed protein n=1 Tax=Allacma fusca TaxID=39272 RepID=A0A8J2JIE7_9HEXA|nr:unnamed protein product [Allacma fusca]